MAVDSKQGATGAANGTANGNAVNGATASGQRTKGGRKRPSSLMAQATSLPTVEHSLEEFIAKANQTLVDVSTWGNADTEARQEDDKRREQDAVRMKAAEHQLREGEVREHTLRRQLDGLQGKLAEAEARAAVAGTTVGSAAHDATINQLRAQIQEAEAQRRAFEAKTQHLSAALSEAKSEVALARSSAPAIEPGDSSDAAERIRLAEAKAAKALAAARAAQAGLTVSSADLAAIESGLVVTNLDTPKSTPWVAILIAFVGGLAIMFAVWKFALNKDDAKPAPSASPPPAATEPVQATEPAGQPAKPIVTPIEDGTEAAGATEPVAEPAVEPAVEPVVDPAAEKAAAEAQAKAELEAAKAQAAADKADREAAKKQEARDAKAKAAAERAAKKAAAKARPAAKKTVKKPAAGGIADPFAEPAKKPAKKPTKPAKPSGGIVDPF